MHGSQGIWTNSRSLPTLNTRSRLGQASSLTATMVICLSGMVPSACLTGAGVRALQEGDREDCPGHQGHVPGEGYPGPLLAGGLSLY